MLLDLSSPKANSWLGLITGEVIEGEAIAPVAPALFAATPYGALLIARL